MIVHSRNSLGSPMIQLRCDYRDPPGRTVYKPRCDFETPAVNSEERGWDGKPNEWRRHFDQLASKWLRDNDGKDYCPACRVVMLKRMFASREAG